MWVVRWMFRVCVICCKLDRFMFWYCLVLYCWICCFGRKRWWVNFFCFYFFVILVVISNVFKLFLVCVLRVVILLFCVVWYVLRFLISFFCFVMRECWMLLSIFGGRLLISCLRIWLDDRVLLICLIRVLMLCFCCLFVIRNVFVIDFGCYIRYDVLMNRVVVDRRFDFYGWLCDGVFFEFICLRCCVEMLLLFFFGWCRVFEIVGWVG